MHRIIIILLVFMFIYTSSVFASSGWIVYHEQAFRGKVIDANTREPIEGAVVVAMYRIREYSFIQSDAAVADVKEVLTDKNGEFQIPPHTFVSFYPVAKGEITTFLVFKPGYASISELSLGDILSGDRGREREVPWLYNKDLKFIFAPGLIGLPKLKKEERLKAIPSIPGNSRFDNSTMLPLYYKEVNEERRRFGLEKAGDKLK